MDMVIPFAEAANIACFHTTKPGYNAVTLTVVGLMTTETITIEVPKVMAPIAATDAHWTPLYQVGDIVQLTSTNNSITVPVDIVVRLKKALSTGNAFGVRRS